MLLFAVVKGAKIHMGVQHDMKKETIGKRVRKARKMRNYSQEQLGDKADVSQQHISRIENDEICPTLDTLIKLAKALNVSVIALTNEEILVEGEKDILEMVKKLELLSEESKLKVSGYIDCLYQDEIRKYGIKRFKQT